MLSHLVLARSALETERTFSDIPDETSAPVERRRETPIRRVSGRIG